MQLTEQERAEALTTLKACGFEEDDASTSLRTVEILATQDDLQAWVHAHQHVHTQALATQYGHDAARAARTLAVHHPRE